MNNNFKQKQRHAKHVLGFMLNDYHKINDDLPLSYKKLYLELIEKRISIFESKKYDVGKYREKFTEIKNNLETKLK